MEKLAAAVIAYDRSKLLKQCVDALMKQTTPCDILIVNNVFTDDTEV